MNPTYRVVARNLKQLEDLVTVPAGGSEAIAAELYDQATFTDAVTTSLEFFTTTRANKQLTNAGGRGQLQSSQFFEIAFLQVAIMVPPAETTAVADDLWNLLYGTGAATGAPTVRFLLNGKEYGRWSLYRAAAGGGVIMSGYAATTTAATDIQNEAASVPCGGGLWLDQSITIPPLTDYSLTIEWAAAVDIAADVQIRPSFVGTLHRRPQ